MIANRLAIVLVGMVLALLAAACSTSGQEPRSASAYFVGNSLTNETLGPIVEGRRSLAAMTEQVDFETDPLGWHIRCGSSLIGIAMNPDDTCVDPHVDGATYPDALDDADWDIAVFQPYPGPGSTLATDIEVIAGGVADLPESAQVLIFTGWPPLETYSLLWERPVEPSSSTPTTAAREYFAHLTSALQPELDQSVFVIPTGEVLHRLGIELETGAVPGFTGLEDLYRDEIHLNPRGTWVSRLTAATVITGSGAEAFRRNTNDQFPEEFVTLVRTIVDEVLAEIERP